MQLNATISTHNCVRDLDARGGHVHIDIEPSVAHCGELVHGLIQDFHSHSMRYLTRPNVRTLDPLVVFVAPMHCTVAHSRSVI